MDDVTYVFIDDVQWAHLHAYFDPSIRRESYVTIVQAARIIPRINGMPYRVPTEARIAFNKVRLGYPIFPLFSVDESHYFCLIAASRTQDMCAKPPRHELLEGASTAARRAGTHARA